MTEHVRKAAVTRRDALRAAGAAGALILCRSMSPTSAFQGSDDQSAQDVDHIMWGSRDLDAGIALVEAKTGVKAAFGGIHPNRGTRNALLSLGTRQYLEILSLDPAQPDSRDERTSQLRSLTSPRILTWAAAARDIEALERNVRAAGLETSGVADGSRKKPDGTLLRWKTFSVRGHDNDVIPFLIEWAPGTTHPSADSPGGCRIRELRLEHPDPAKVNRFLEVLGLRVRARQGTRARITAILVTPKGDVELT